MAGKNYYQMVRCHSLMSEAMLRLLWNVFQRWLNMEDQSDITDSVKMLHSSLDACDGTDCLQNRCRRVQAALNEAEPLFDEFVGSLGMTRRY